MTSDSPGNQLPSSSPCRRHGWAPLAITSVLSIVLMVILFSRRDYRPPLEPTPTDEPRPAPQVRSRALPLPPGVVPELHALAPPLGAMTATLHSVILEARQGAPVLHIRAHADGDELIVDAATGRLLSIRDAKGKTIPWPMSPTNATELPLKNSRPVALPTM